MLCESRQPARRANVRLEVVLPTHVPVVICRGVLLNCPPLLCSVAISMACRLRFCRKLDGGGEEAAGAGVLPSPGGLAGALEQLDLDAMLRSVPCAARCADLHVRGRLEGGSVPAAGLACHAAVGCYLLSGLK